MTIKKTNFHFRDQQVTTPGHTLQCHCEDCRILCKMCAMVIQEREHIARTIGAPLMLSEARECYNSYHRKAQFATTERAAKLRQRCGIVEPAK